MVGGDPQDPGGRRRGSAELGERAQGPGEHLLQRVLGGLVVPQEEAAAAVDRRRMLLVQLAEEPRVRLGAKRAGDVLPGPPARDDAQCAHGPSRYCGVLMLVPNVASA